jgi:peroxiredoxin
MNVQALLAKRSHAVIAFIAVSVLAALAYLLQLRPAAPDAAFVTLNGARMSVRELRGKVVYVNFWATSCATCIKEMPEVVKTYQRFASRDFELLGVAMSYDPPPYVREYVRRHQLHFKIVLDRGGSIAAAFDNVNLTPTAVLIDRHGRILRRIVGEPDFPALNALVEQELQR